MTVEARLTCGGVCRTIPLTQYDEGQKIHLNGIILPASYLAEFANSESCTAEQIAQTTDTVTIPDKYLTSGNPVYVWIVVVGEDERTTRYEIIVPVRGRGEPDDYTPTPSEQTAIEAAIAALNEAVTEAGVAITHYPKIEDGVWYVWDVSSGEWISTGVSATGEDGVSPIVSVSAITGGHRLTITDADGDHVFDVMDGEPGQPGYSPTASVSKSGNTATITITDQQGTTTATVTDGENGQDGYSPTAIVTKSGSTATISITDKNGTTTAQVTDGSPGPGVPAGGTTGQMLVKKSDTDYDGEWANQPTVPVQDVQVNGTSILNNGVANVPVASADNAGAVVVRNYNDGLIMSGDKLTISGASENLIKNGGEYFRPIVPYRQHISTFYGLAKAAGDSTQSASSNAVGTYTDAAKVAIQKMLGIYEAPWELIREDTVTNATEADIEITVDGNGNAFELTDVLINFWLPQQETESKKGDSGRIRLYYDSSNFDQVFIGQWTQAANASSQGSFVLIEQSNGLIKKNVTSHAISNSDLSLLTRYSSTENAGAYVLASRSYSKIIITSVTGEAKYRIYGKRKWT